MRNLWTKKYLQTISNSQPLDLSLRVAAKQSISKSLQALSHCEWQRSNPSINHYKFSVIANCSEAIQTIILFINHKNKMNLIEPQRWLQLLLTINQTMLSSSTRSTITPILADIFVFSYPVYLGVIYSMGRIRKQISYKIAALWIFANVVITTLVNIWIQTLVQKSRPNIVLWLVENKETVLHKYLPSSSFPSDHAAVSMSIAVASLLRWIHKKDKKYIILGIILIAFSLIMSTARIATAVHWPTDIMWWLLIWAIIPLLLSSQKISSFWEKIFGWFAKKI